MTATSDTVFLLRGAVQAYAWGKRGADSKVAQYARRTPGFVVDPDGCYAELWLGTHPSGPAQVLSVQNEPLGALRSALSPALLGSAVANEFGGDLPFLLKVLSVRTALSIQAHPDKDQARVLHAARPDLYKDGNHKPELAVALTPFEALCGFRPLEEIAAFLHAVPELRTLVGDPAAAQLAAAVDPLTGRPLPERQAALRAVFASLMQADAAHVAQQLERLVARIASDPVNAAAVLSAPVAELVGRLHTQFPGDVGCFCVFLLNYMQLQPGQAIFLAARLPHAYLSGDCVECMATSDNVVRAGLTPKFRDVATLVDLIAYDFGPAGAFLLNPTPLAPAAPPSPTLSPNKRLPLALSEAHPPAPAAALAVASSRPTTFLYRPGVREFQLARTGLAPGESAGWMAAVNGPSVLLVTAGSGTMVIEQPLGRWSEQPLREGDTYFVGPQVAIALGASSAADSTGLVVFRAFCPGPVFDDGFHL